MASTAEAAALAAARAAGAPPQMEADGGATMAAVSGAPAAASTATGVKDDRVICQGTEAEKTADFANYFCSYAYVPVVLVPK